jgi:hypothetical protein
MSEARRELDRRLEVIVARLHRDPAMRAELARLDRQAAAARLAELALLEVKTDPAASTRGDVEASDAATVTAPEALAGRSRPARSSADQDQWSTRRAADPRKSRA